jgi:aminoglycoside phosphotransferase (APT) family kinase protein
MLASLTPEQLRGLVHRVFPDADVVSGERVAGQRDELHYDVQLSNLMNTTIKVYGGLDPEHAADKEIRLLRMITSETGVPVPRVLYSADRLPDEDESTTASHPWALLTRLPGELLSKVIDALDDTELESVVYETGRYLAHIHQIPLDKFGMLFVPGPHDHVREKGYVLAQAGQWLDACTQNELLTRDTVVALRQRFQDTEILDRRRPCLIHGDFGVDRVVVEHGQTGYHVTGILGFGQAQGGSPEFDVSTLFAWHYDRQPSLRKGFLDGYTESGELTARFWERLALYQAFVSLRNMLLAHQQNQVQQEQADREQILRYAHATQG